MWKGFILAALIAFLTFARCTRPIEQREGDRVQQDSILLGPELDSAKAALTAGYPQRCDSFARLSLATWKEGDPLSRKNKALGYIGIAQHQQGVEDSARAYLQQALELSLADGDSAQIASNRQDLAMVYCDIGDYPKAQEMLLAVLGYRERMSDSVRLSGTLNNLSAVHYYQGDRDAAIADTRRAIHLDSLRGDSIALTTMYNNLSRYLNEQQRFEEVVPLLRRNMSARRRLQPERSLAAMESNMASAFLGLEQWDSSLVHARRVVEEGKSHGQRFMEALGAVNEARALRAMGRLPEALSAAQRSLLIAEELGRTEQVMEAHKTLHLILRDMKRYEEALTHAERSHALSDSLVNAERDKTMLDARTRYESDRKERENERLREANELSEARVSSARWAMAVLVAGALVLILAGALFFQRGRTKARLREQALEMQAMRLRLDPHFLFNALTTIPGLYASSDHASASRYVEHLSDLLRLILETSGEQEITLGQELRLTEHYLHVNASRHPGRFTWTVEVDEGIDQDRVMVPPMVLQPIVENALLHGLASLTEDGRIEVSVAQEGAALVCRVIDNGVGRQASSVRRSHELGTGRGMAITAERIARFNAGSGIAEGLSVVDLKSDDGTAQGTLVILRTRTTS